MDGWMGVGGCDRILFMVDSKYVLPGDMTMTL
jgi:hypothetical protein